MTDLLKLILGVLASLFKSAGPTFPPTTTRQPWRNWDRTRRRPSGLRLRQTIHAVESGLHRRDQLAVVEGLCQPTQRLREFRAGLHGRIGQRRSEHAADAEALKDLDGRVDPVAFSRKIDVHQHQLRPAIHRRTDGIVGGDDGVDDVIPRIEERVPALMRDEIIVLDDQNAARESGIRCRLGFSIRAHCDAQRFHVPFPLPAAELRPEMGQKLAESPIGAWIETQKQSALELLGQVAPHAGAWIETFLALSASPWDAPTSS